MSDPVGFFNKLIRAYHGSPYAFDKFDPTKIGSGEGAQAYGYGHYFTDKEDIARGYRDKLTEDRYRLPTGEFFSLDNLQHRNVRARSRRLGTDLQGMLDEALKLRADQLSDQSGLYNMVPLLDRDIEMLKGAIGAGGITKAPGHMYDVNLGVNPQDLLNWDKPLREQSTLPLNFGPQRRNPDWTGRDLYQQWDTPERTAEQMREAGISGIKYLDGFSRGAGEGTSNYVMFPGTEDRIRINKRYEQGGPVDTPTEGEGGMYGAPDSMFNTPESLAAALYPQHNTAYADGGPVDTSRPSDAYFNDPSVGSYRPLNFESLVGSGAARITQPGNGRDGGYTASDDPEMWSLVSHANDTHPDSQTRAWPDKPSSYESASRLLNEPGMSAGKYRQLVWSAQQRGMADKDIYLPSEHYPQHNTAYGGGGKVLRKAGQLARDALLGDLPEYKPSEETYLRFGKWPKSERSRNYIEGGREEGVSVYPLAPHGGPPLDWSDSGELDSHRYQRLKGSVFPYSPANPKQDHNHPSFLVQGREVGIGQDGEPLLREVKPLSRDWHSPQVGDNEAAPLSYFHRYDDEPLPGIVKPFDDQFADGGPVHMALGGTPPNTAPTVPDMPQLPESEGAGYFRNNDYENYAGPENWLKKLGAPTIQRPGKVQDVHNWATKVGGAEQGRRVEQAADLTNLGHFSSNALHETFAPGNSSLLMALPPSVFEHFSARLPDEYMARTPYGRWKNNVPGQERIPDSQKTMDAYLAQLRDHMDRGGANEVPAMWLAPPRPLHGEVVDHQGRHRARALAQARDENMLLQIRPSNDGDMRGSLAERLARLTDKYFPSGAATRFEPQMDWKRRTPLSFPFAPFAEGGEVHMSTGGQYDAPEPEGPGFFRNQDNYENSYAGPPELVKEGTRTVLARQHMRDTPRGRAAPPDPRIQTVRDPERMVYPGIYKDPNVIAEEASRRLMRDQGKDGPMSLLFGHTRASLDELSQGRDLEGMRPWPLRQAYTPPGGSTGSAVSEQVLTRRNANRLLDIHGEAMKYPGLRETRSWYEMLPLYQRMDELGVPIDEQRLFNQRTGIFSAAASPVSEINRGTLAHHLAQQGRIEDFVKYGGVAAKNRPSLLGFPDDLLDMKSHAYHGTAQAPTLAEIEMSGGYYPKEHKVGTYVAATDPVFPNYTRPVADSHIARGVGYSDVRPGKLANVKANLSNPEYTDFAPWWENSIAGNTGLRSRDQQALLWNVLGPQTGVRYIGPSKLELMSNQMMKASKRLGVSPEVARDMVLRGEAGAYKEGGTVEDQYHPIWQQGFQSGGQPKSDTRDWLREKPEQDTRDWKLARPDTSRTLPEPVTRGWYRAEPDTSRTLSEPDTRDLLFRTRRFAGGGQPDTLPVQWDQDYDYENDPRDRSTVSGNLADALYGGRITPTPEERRAFREERAARRAEHPEGVYSTDPVRAVLGLLQKQRAGWQADQAEMYPGESSPWQRAGDQLGHMGRTLAHDVTGGLSDKLIAALSPGDYSANVPREEAATRSSRGQLDPYVRGPLSVLPFALSPAQQIKQYAMTVGSNLAEPAHGAIDWARKQFDKSMLGMVRPTAEGVSGALSPALNRPMWDKGYDHGGSVEDQYHPIWSQNFEEGGSPEHAPDFGDNFEGIPGLGSLADIAGGLFGGEDVDLHDILGEGGRALGTLIGAYAGMPGVGGSLGEFGGNFASNLIEPDNGEDTGQDAMRIGSGFARGQAMNAFMADGGPVDDFTEPGMPFFGVGVPEFDVDPLRTNPQVARDAEERRRLLGQVQADSQKGLAEQMKASSSGGGGGGGMGGILSSLAPFASMIPGYGPMISMGMNMAGKMMAADGGPVKKHPFFDKRGKPGEDWQSMSMYSIADIADDKVGGYGHLREDAHEWLADNDLSQRARPAHRQSYTDFGRDFDERSMAEDKFPMFADGGSIPAPNGEQPWMYGGGALMARGGYLRGHGGMNG